MADEFPSPTSIDQQLRTLATQRDVTLGTPAGASSLATSPQFGEWWKGAQDRLFGQQLQIPEDPARLAIMRGVMNLGRPVADVSIPVPESWQVYQPAAEFDFLKQFKHGFDDSFLGSLRAWSALDGAMHMKADPSYDPFTDRQIKDSPYAGQWHFFETSRSADETQWIIRRLAEKQKVGDDINRMNGPTAPGQMVGGILGDPLSFLPLSFGAKGAWLASRGRQLNALEQGAFGFKPVVLGGMADGMRAIGAQAAIQIGQHAIRSGVDPTYELDSMAELLALPMALAGTAGWAVGSFERFSNALNVLSRRRMADPDFLKGTFAAGRAVPKDAVEAAAEHGPLGVDPAGTVPAGRFPGLRPVENEIQAAVEAGDFKLAEKLRKKSLTDPRDLALEAGALATHYPDMRAREAEASGFGVVTDHPDFTAFMAGSKIVNAKGEPVVAYHGTTGGFAHLDPAHAGEASAFGGHGGTWFTLDPEAAGAYARGEGGNIRPSYLRALNPKNITSEIEKLPLPDPADHAALFEHMQKTMASVNKAIERARAAGHDAVTMELADGLAKPTTQVVVFDAKQIKAFSERYHVAPAGAPGSVGAAASPASSLYNRAQLLAEGRMVPTGIGLEKLPIDIITRAAMLPFTSWHGTVEDLLGSGGRLRNKNLAGVPSALPVETEIARRWARPMVEAIREQHDAWRAYREELSGVQTGKPNPTDIGRIGYEMKARFTDWMERGERPLSFEAFRRRVGDAQITRDADEVIDAATPHVNRAAAALRKHYDDLATEGQDVGLFKAAYERQIERMEMQRKAARSAHSPNPERLAEIEARMKAAQELLDNVVKNGPTTNTAPSYRPRYWLVDELMDREADFKKIVVDHYTKTEGMDPREARDLANSVHEILTKQRNFITREEIEKSLDRIADPMSAMARTFQIPDRLVKDFLENDSEMILRSHSRTMSTSIEMQRRFGSTGLEAEIDEVMAEAKGLMAKATSKEETAQLRKQAKLAVDDLRAARDKLFGTYGADRDPHTWDNRLIRLAKQFTNLTLLGGAGMTAMGDLLRPLMTEGLQATHHYGFKTLASESRATILKMSRKELELAGDALEIMNNVRALSASDTGDVLHSRTKFERWMNQANQYFFVANGLNAVNQLDKEWAGVIIQGRINDIAARYARHETIRPGSAKLSDADRTRLAAHGIDATMLKRIGDEIRTHGEEFGSIAMANSDQWTDEVARQHYGNALNQMVNRTVPTPGKGDTANWMSSPVGGLISQYKSFATGALTRILYSGLQEGGAKFWYGAAVAVAGGIILNEIRSRLFYDRSTFDRPLTGVIADGVERSSILGWFSDVNRAVETLSGHKMGAKPWLGAERAHKDDTSRQMGTLFGPAIGQGFNATDVLSDFLSNHPTAKTWANARKLVPGNTLPYLDPAFDHAISDGRWHPEVRRSGRRGE